MENIVNYKLNERIIYNPNTKYVQIRKANKYYTVNLSKIIVRNNINTKTQKNTEKHTVAL